MYLCQQISHGKRGQQRFEHHCFHPLFSWQRDMSAAADIGAPRRNRDHEAQAHIDNAEQDRPGQREPGKGPAGADCQICSRSHIFACKFFFGPQFKFADRSISPKFIILKVPHPSSAGTIADGAPIIPISAQLKYNIDAACEYIYKKIPIPVRDFTSEPRLIGKHIFASDNLMKIKIICQIY